jgi:hypothetical protein
MKRKVWYICFPSPLLYLLLAQGFKMERTTMIAITIRMIIAINMHFLDFFCRLFAVRSASVPVTTWFTAF